jgi:hypothetical protein
MKCSYAAFGEQNKTDNDSKCQQVYKSPKNSNFGRLPWLFMPHNIATHKSQFPRSYCHPTQPILQLHSHYLQKWLHLASNLQYPPSNEFEWNIEYRMQIDNLSFFYK